MNTKRHANCQLRNDWKERIIRIGDEQTSLQNQFDNLRNDFSDNSPRIAALETDVNALDGRVIIAESDIAAAENRISACENDIDRIDAELVDKTGDINALANRMSLAEADIDSIDARVSGIETGEILLSQLVPDADKDMGGKTLSNVGIDANSLTVNGSKIEPSRINNQIVLWDGQPDIEAEHNGIGIDGYGYETEQLTPYNKYGKVIDYKFKVVGPYIPVIPGERIYAEAWARRLEGESTYNTGNILIARYDKDKKPIGPNAGWVSALQVSIPNDNIWRKYTGSITIPTTHEPYNGSDGGPVRFIRYVIYFNAFVGANEVNYMGIKIYREANFNSNLSAKNISADAVIIKDGGTVDGVDVSTHNHDGTSVGGATLSNVPIDASTLTVRGSQIEPGRVNNHTVLWDATEEIKNEKLKLSGGCSYIASSDIDNCPYPKYIRHVSGQQGYIGQYPIDEPNILIPVIPNSKVYLGIKYRKSSLYAIAIHYRFYDRNKTFISASNQSTVTQSANWIDYSYSITVPENAYYLHSFIEINKLLNCDICEWKIWTDAKFDSDLSAKNIAADAVIIKDGATINATKTEEWDEKARPPAYRRYYNDNLTTPTTEYLEPSAGRSAFIPMKITAEAEDGNGNVAIYAIFDDSSELLLGRASSPTNGFSLTADQIAQKLGDGNKSGRTITRFKIQQEMAGVGEARIDAYEY